MNTPKTTEKATYTLADVGCYVDSARGIYAIDRIIEIAESHGMTSVDYSDKTEFANEVEDDCDSFMNDKYGVEGAYWGRNENGDWGLWALDDNPTEPQDDDYTISPCGTLGGKYAVGIVNGKFLGEFNTREQAEKAIKADMEASQYFPSVWTISDHGNANLITLGV